MDAMAEKESNFGQRLQQLRKAAGLTQAELAQRSGLSAKSIAALERGRRQHPHPPTVRALAQALGLSEGERAAFAATSAVRATPVETGGSLLQPGEAFGSFTGTDGASKTHAGIPILTTKLYLPQPSSDIVRRTRLHTRLERAIAGTLTVIAAPAGFGKTTLLADWLSAAIQQPNPPLRPGQIAWLSLDTTDSDPAEFLRYLVAAFQSITPTIGRTNMALLHSAQTPSIETLLPLLVNELTALPQPSVLVLDDYHVIDSPAIHQALAFLLDHLPPQLHLIIATRSDPPLPLSRLRVRRQLTELRAQDLRFTHEEVASFLHDAMALPLTALEVATLETRTEGWIAGLQLAALSLQDRTPEQVAHFINLFAGSNRFIVDYLVDEVLARQPAHLQMFLLQTSILERLCGPLCDAIILGGESASRHTRHAYSQLLLEELERSNLFIVPLDETRYWYRYHHLFAQVLRHRLLGGANPETVTTLHRRASIWFEQQGLIDDAVRHAFDGLDLDRAIELIERHALALIECSEELIVRRWVDQVPPALIETRPQLAMIVGWLYASLNRFEDLDRLLDTLISAPDAANLPAAILGEVALLRATSARMQGQHIAALKLAHQALALLPADRPALQVRAIVTIGICLMQQGDMAAAETAFHEAASIAHSRGSQANALVSIYWLATLYDRLGRVSDRLRVYEQALRMNGTQRGALLPLVGALWIGIGDVLYERNELERARPAVIEGLRLINGSIEWYLAWNAYVTLAQIHQAQGAGEAALAALEQAAEWALRRQNENRQFHDMLSAYRARIDLRQGSLAAALQWADTYTVGDELRLSPVRRFTLIRVRLALYRQLSDQSGLHNLAELVARLLAMAENQRWVRLQIELLMLQALIFQAQGDLQHALNELKHSLTLAAPEGYVRLFVDEGQPMAALLRSAQGAGIMQEYVTMLLSAFSHNIEPPGSTDTAIRLPLQAATAPLPIQNSPELLTERELEVLRLLAQGYSNHAIAQELIVTVGTVKRHVSNIMGKLEAQSRLDAVARARSRGLA